MSNDLDLLRKFEASPEHKAERAALLAEARELFDDDGRLANRMLGSASNLAELGQRMRELRTSIAHAKDPGMVALRQRAAADKAAKAAAIEAADAEREAQKAAAAEAEKQTYVRRYVFLGGSEVGAEAAWTEELDKRVKAKMAGGYARPHL